MYFLLQSVEFKVTFPRAGEQARVPRALASEGKGGTPTLNSQPSLEARAGCLRAALIQQAAILKQAIESHLL